MVTSLLVSLIVVSAVYKPYGLLDLCFCDECVYNTSDVRMMGPRPSGLLYKRLPDTFHVKLSFEHLIPPSSFIIYSAARVSGS